MPQFIRQLSKEELSALLKTVRREEICTQFNISPRTLSRVLVEMDLVNHNYGPKNLTQEQKNEIVRLYTIEGVKQQFIAKRFGITQSLVSRIVMKEKAKNSVPHCDGLQSEERPQADEAVVEGHAETDTSHDSGNKSDELTHDVDIEGQ